MKKVEISVYEFNELDKKLQERIYEENKRQAYEDYCEMFLYNDMEFKAKELLLENFGEKAKLNNLYYDLSYGQGDYVVIEFTTENYKTKLYYHTDFAIEYFEDFEDNYNDEQYKELKLKIAQMNYELQKYGYDLLENCVSETDVDEYITSLYYYSDGRVFGEITE